MRVSLLICHLQRNLRITRDPYLRNRLSTALRELEQLQRRAAKKIPKALPRELQDLELPTRGPSTFRGLTFTPSYLLSLARLSDPTTVWPPLITAGNAMAPNPLISIQKSSDGLQVALHPLALLTISDYITRHTLRDQKQPIIGALLGQQNGREITIEHAFEVLLVSVDSEIKLHKAWFEERLQQSM